MEIEDFFTEMMAEEYPHGASKLRTWWERTRLNIWLKAPVTLGKKETNRDFVESIPYDH